MGIVNAGMLGVYDDLDPALREKVEDVVLKPPRRRRTPGRNSRRRSRKAKTRTPAPT